MPVGNQLGRGYEEVHGKVRTKKTPSRGLHRRVDVDVLVEFWGQRKAHRKVERSCMEIQCDR